MIKISWKIQECNTETYTYKYINTYLKLKKLRGKFCEKGTSFEEHLLGLGNNDYNRMRIIRIIIIIIIVIE